ncbi:MAG: hypothetical protein MZV65_37950 [Chromatiales bacterium]|nr:hypothetical protein [Chromatiales bacterium]
MIDWNVVVSVRGGGSFKAGAPLPQDPVARVDAHRLLQRAGARRSTTSRCSSRRCGATPDSSPSCVPVAGAGAAGEPGRSVFQGPEPSSTDQGAPDGRWPSAPPLAGRAFYVRIHRRGFRGLGESPSQAVELARPVAARAAWPRPARPARHSVRRPRRRGRPSRPSASGPGSRLITRAQRGERCLFVPDPE